MIIDRRKCNTVRYFALLTILVFSPACDRATERLPDQVYNRMVYVHSGSGADASETFIDMPKHYDLGSPSLSADGKWIAFDCMTIGDLPERETWIVDTKGNGLRKINNSAAPRWSPDGKRLLISRLVTLGALAGRYEVLEYDVAGKQEKMICEGRFPDWSPDGKKIAFAKEGERTENSGVHPGSKVYIANSDGSGAAELCDGNWPSWSPDGKKIAFCVQEEQPGAMWVIDLETKEKMKIALGFYRAQWSSDSKGFVCNGAYPIQGYNVPFHHLPARFKLDKPLEPEYFGRDLDNPWSPCVSRDGKTTLLIVDSKKHIKKEDRLAPEPPSEEK